LDKAGNKRKVFKTGDDISIRVRFKQNKPLKSINFGLAIFNQEGHYAFGTNTINDKINTEKYRRQCYCQVDYKNIPLRADIYYIGFAIYGENETIAYDYRSKAGVFKVFSDDKNFGMVKMDYSWAKDEKRREN
jgi:hypothetical protein